MEDAQKTKADIRDEMAAQIGKLSAAELKEKTRSIEDRLFDFANFLEAKIVLLYVSGANEVNSEAVIKRAFDQNKIVVLPMVNNGSKNILLYKIDDYPTGLRPGSDGKLEPNPEKCRKVPIDCIDIAIIPGVAFDEKGGRVGPGDGFYDRLIPHLPITTRKVALALDNQVLVQVPTESHDKQVDIIITEKRIIYKI
jgi:5-formyltetrahydrofolate cyclo-ligase